MQTTLLNIDQISLVRSGQTILNKLSLTVAEQELVEIHGANGTGKSSLLLAVLGLLPIASGSIEINGYRVGSSDWRKIRRTAAWVPQEGVLHRFPISAQEVVATGLASRRMSCQQKKRTIEQALSISGTAHLDTHCFHHLSAGQRQKVLLARCLVQGASLLLLDEPTAFLDKESRIHFVDLLQSLVKSGLSIIIVTHTGNMFPDWREYHLEGGRLCCTC